MIGKQRDWDGMGSGSQRWRISGKWTSLVIRAQVTSLHLAFLLLLLPFRHVAPFNFREYEADADSDTS